MNFEFEFLHALQTIHNDILDQIMLFITGLGDGGLIWIITALLLMIVPAVGKETGEHVRERRRAGLIVLLSLALTALCVNIFIKNIVQRPRPFQVDTSVIPLIFPGETSFPSGHTASSFTAAMAIFFYRKKAGIAALFLATMIAFTRLYLFVHFPTDVLGGMIIGVLCAFIIRKCMRGRLERQGNKNL